MDTSTPLETSVRGCLKTTFEKPKLLIFMDKLVTSNANHFSDGMCGRTNCFIRMKFMCQPSSY